MADFVDSSVSQQVDTLEREHQRRDERMRKIRMVREGEIQGLWPDQFSDRYPQSVVANYIDVTARAIAEVVAPLPSIFCSSGQMKTEADKARAAKKSRIGEYYWRHSNLEIEMEFCADQYLSYSFAVARLEPDTKAKCPKIRLDDPHGAYYRLDRDRNVTFYCRVWKQSPEDLCSLYPENAHLITPPKRTGMPSTQQEHELKVVYAIDDTNVTVFLPDRNGLILSQYAHRMPYVPVVVAERPGINRKDPRGQFDDVIWVQAARAELAQLALEAGHKAVEAPITVPSDVTELNVGPDAILQTDNPQGVGRVHIQVPPEVFALGQELNDELNVGSRVPDAKLGITQASVITGKGIQALMGTFDTQVKTAQTVLGRMLHHTTEQALEMDEIWWPNVTKTFNGSYSGESYQVTYTPKKDINGNYTCDVTYGLALGMSPQNALIMALQARGDGLIPRDTVRQMMHSVWQIDQEQAQRDLDVQEMEDGLKQGILAALQAADQMIAQGQVQQALMFFELADQIIQGRQNGVPLNQITSKFWQNYVQQQQAAQQAQAAAAQAGAEGSTGPGGEPLPGVQPNGLPYGVANGQAGLTPGGMPPVQSLVAGFTGNMQNPTPTMGSTVRRRQPVG